MAKEANHKSPVSGDVAACKSRSLGRRLIRVLGVGLILLLVLFGLSNLWLWSGWGTGMVESELEKRTGVDWEIDRMSWSPWNGLSIYDAEMLQPQELQGELSEPIMHVQSLRVMPYWKKVLRGKLRPKRIEIENPTFKVSVEMLAAMAANTVQKKPPPDTANLAKQPSAPNVPKESQKTNNDGLPEKTQPAKPRQDTVQSGSKEPRKSQSVRSDPVSLSVKGADIMLVSVKKETELLHITDAGIEMDLMGDDSEGVLRVGSLSVLGMQPVTDIEQPVIWKAPYFGISEQAMDCFGVKVNMIAQLGLGYKPVGRWPFQLSMTIDQPQLEKIPFADRIGMHMATDQLQAWFRVNGFLHQPVSWRADAILAVRQLSIKELHGGHDLEFDEVMMPFVFKRGVLQWGGLRFVSDDLAILGNGAVSLRDGHLSVTRIVTSPEGAAILKRGLCGAGVTRPRDRWWKRLNTPDREMRDLLVSGPLLDPVVDAGEKHREIKVMSLAQMFLDFIRGELSEKDQGLHVLNDQEGSER